MSMAALLIASRDRLRADPGAELPGLGYRNLECEVGWDGKPPPISGDVFLSVHPGVVSETNVEGRATSYQYSVTLSMKLGAFPVDRWGPEAVAKVTTGFYQRADAIAALLHRNLNVFAQANEIIGEDANGFTECQRFLGYGLLQQQGPDWWWAEDQPAGQAPVGLSLEIRFGEIFRYQTYESQS